MKIKKFSRIIFIVTGTLISLQFIVCGKENGADKQKAVDMITARTMGLAYLEENKLPEAEKAFKQLIEIAPQEALGMANLGIVYIRMGNYEQAELNLQKALRLEPNDPEIQLNLAEIFLLTNRKKEAIQLLENSLNHNPNHIRTLFKLGQNFSRSEVLEKRKQGETMLDKVVAFLPANIAARLELIDLLLRNNKADSGLAHMEELRKQMPEFPAAANEFYDTSLQFMQQNNATKALPPFNIFKNIIKPTPLFRAGTDELTGMSGPLIGTPVVTFRKDLSLSTQSDQIVLETMKFTDVTSDAGLDVIPQLSINPSIPDHKPYTLAVADVDGDGTQDLYVSGWDKKNVRFMLWNDFGKYKNGINETGINHQGKDLQAIFADYDNDGYLDLYLVNDRKNVLYYHYKPRKFRDQALSAGVSGKGLGQAACFADFDHDGDLDIYQANSNQNQFFRNNLDGTFTEDSKRMGVAGNNTPSGETILGDFDDDGDLDFFVLNKDKASYLYTNLRQGRFADISAKSGLSTEEGTKHAVAGDYNNDGRLDLFILPQKDQSIKIFTNIDGNHFEEDNRSTEMKSILDRLNCQYVELFDFDNDGYLDLLITGEPKEQSSQNEKVLLFHNDGKGIFSDASHILPDHLPAGYQIVTADYNEDGDLDIYLSGYNGKIYLLRNDGGNANHYLKVQLVGLRTGSGKNNYFGIGAKVEVKSGDLYQSCFVSKPVSHFGLGSRAKADIVRVLWTNGVPQNLFEPGSDQALLEKQILKGSCPFLYAWNGEKFEFVTDVLWRSALGMPLGIMGGETAYAFPDPSEDYFKIPGDQLKEKDGKYLLQLTAELWETAYFDQVKLLVVDHPDSSEIYIDERFTPPPFPQLKIHKVNQKKYPVSIVDERGNDLRHLTDRKDNVYISNLRSDRHQGITHLHDLIIDLGPHNDNDPILLFLNGWLFPTDASINVAISQSNHTAVYPPLVQVKNHKGQWQTVMNNVSFPMGKNKTLILDLTNKFLTEDFQVRIRTTMQIYWDYIFYTTGYSDSPHQIQTLIPESADLHYRGFSRMYRKGGRYGPFWFDYSNVTKEPLWRDLVGYYTRYGEVRDLLTEQDSKYIITNAGDEISLEFDAGVVPKLKPGWKRDYIIYTNGWLKDGDLNTASGQTVEPLPFRGMSKYPYGNDETYPQNEEYKEYLETYNTRKVSTERLHNYLKN